MVIVVAVPYMQWMSLPCTVRWQNLRSRGSSFFALRIDWPVQVEERIQAQQKKGDVAAGLKKYGDALAAYDEALKDVPERHSLVAHLHGSKAAVFLMDGKCDTLHPASVRAMLQADTVPCQSRRRCGGIVI